MIYISIYIGTALDETNNKFEGNILRDFKNAPFYIICLFLMINLRMYSLSFLSSR